MTDTKIAEAQARADEAARVATEWSSNVAAITSKIEDAKAGGIKIRDERKTYALAAALDKAGPSSALKALHEEEAELGRVLADLEHALEMARGRFSGAEGEHAAAVREVLRAQAREVADRRVKAAERFDASMRAADGAIKEFSELLHEVPDVDGSSLSMSVMEIRRGENRVVAAIGPGLKRVLDIAGYRLGGHAPLAPSERAIWRSLA